jgi:hypothetical protein
MALSLRDSKRILGLIDPTMSAPLLDYMLHAQRRAAPVERPQRGFLTWVQGLDESSEEEEDYFFPAPSAQQFTSSGRLPWLGSGFSHAVQPGAPELRFSFR